jgi:hypothetical protein
MDGSGAAMSQIPPKAEMAFTKAVRHYGVIVEDSDDATGDAGQQNPYRSQRKSSVEPSMGWKMHWFLERVRLQSI